MANQNAIQDDSQYPALIGHSGTAGTAETVRVVVNSAGALTVAGAAAGTNINVITGTVTRIGSIDTIGTMPAISLALNSGTITTQAAGTFNTLGTVGVVNSVANIVGGTIGSILGIGGTVQVAGASAGTNVNIVTGTVTTGSLANIAFIHSIGTMPAIAVGESTGGTIDIITRVGNIGTIESGTVTTTLALNTGTITTIAAGTQNTLGTVGTVIGVGTISNIVTTSGTVTGVGVVSAITAGSLTNIAMVHGGTHVHPTGTLTTGSLANVAMLHGGTLANSGTTTGVGVVTSLTSQSAGTLNTLGTVGVVNNIVTGTLASVKVNATPAGSAILTNHVLGTGGTIWGTLVATAGAGTYVYLTGLSIVCHSGTCDYAITNNVAGSSGAGVFARGVFPPGGGIAQTFNPPIATGAAGTIAYLVNGNGTASFTISYWKSP